jgi:hypothetical protein
LPILKSKTDDNTTIFPYHDCHRRFATEKWLTTDWEEQPDKKSRLFAGAMITVSVICGAYKQTFIMSL